ncbi:MAG: hypothetical protein JOY96_02770 [Verrucomicrobia bacterium]|nr:hypothetical protein [Verrucomicrobiota bacterium]
MKQHVLSVICALLFGVSAVQAEHTTVTIAAVNNPDMIELKKLSSKFEQKNPEITLQWVPSNPCIKKAPYTGITFVGIPEFQSFGSAVGQNVAG